MTILENKPETTGKPDTSIFSHLESEVRSYSRGWPAVFDKASGSCCAARTARTTSTSSPAPEP